MSQETDMEAAHGRTRTAPPPPGAARRLAPVVYTWLRTDLFRRTENVPVGWRKIVLAVVAVVVATVISLSRTVGAGSLNTIWIEDAKFLLNQGLNLPFSQAIASPISSYYQEPARIFTEIALQFPLAWTPGVMAIFAAGQYAMYGLVAYIASGPYLRSRWLRLLIAAPVCALPLAYTQVNNDLVTVQFLGLFGGFWTLLWLPGTRAGKILSPIVMATVSWTAALSLVFAPLIVARLIADRSKNAWAVAILWAGGVWLQFSETVLGRSHHQSFGHNGLSFVVHNFVSRVVPRALFGERSLGGAGVNYQGYLAPLHITSTTGHHALIIFAWLIVLVVVALAAFRFTDPDWTLAAVAALFSFGIFLEEMLINTAVVQTRYVVAPAMLLYTALVALMRPRPMAKAAVISDAHEADISRGDDPPYPPVSASGGRRTAGLMARIAAAPAWAAVRWLPVAGFAVLLLVAVTLNFRVTNGRTTSPPWTSVVASATTACTMPRVTSYTYVHEWWWVTIPCGKVR
ncbi:MAG TPA: hypothetical protein VHF26_13600 [Trebonia sp.]|nr:hypothetical protein [Trebonia sp.]